MQTDEYRAAYDQLSSLRQIVTDAALETYTPDGSEVIVGQMLRQQQEIRSLRAEVEWLRERVGSFAVEADADFDCPSWVGDGLRAVLTNGAA